MRLGVKDKELISLASNIALKNTDLYERIDWHVGSALRTKSGKIYIGMNIKNSHSICAEQVAIGQALANGEREFDTIVAVRVDKEGNANVVSPCGLCRYVFSQLEIFDMRVIVPDGKKLIKVKVSELLPYPY
ncbi:MAG: cytidine deaminase [Clostridia bacterium]|nr:cytidine deaminase [Clostridia bacterium]